VIKLRLLSFFLLDAERTGQMFIKRHRKALTITLRVVLVTLGLYVVLVVVGTLLAMELPRVPVKGTPAQVGLVYLDVSFASRDTAVTLKGWFIPASGDAVVMMVHGGYQNRIDPLVDTLDLSRDLVNRGYNVLLFDLRGRGESGGSAHSLLNEDLDIGGAVAYLETLGYPAQKIGIIGYCSGAASTTEFAAGEKIGGVVLDGCFARLRGMVTLQAKNQGIPGWILDGFYNGLVFTAKLLYGFKPLNPVTNVPEISCPILFIHEEYDVLVTAGETGEMLALTVNRESAIWEVKGVKHSEAYRTYPAEYVNKLDAFFQKALK
jgi:pimeloyl-ACP methyl ester carboxylesterase